MISPEISSMTLTSRRPLHEERCTGQRAILGQLAMIWQLGQPPEGLAGRWTIDIASTRDERLVPEHIISQHLTYFVRASLF